MCTYRSRDREATLKPVRADGPVVREHTAVGRDGTSIEGAIDTEQQDMSSANGVDPFSVL